MFPREQTGGARGLLGLAVLLGVPAIGAAADTWWVTYDPKTGRYPEEEGWERVIYPPPAVRWFEDGALVIDSLASIYTADWYELAFPAGGLNPGPGEMFLMRWRLQVAVVSGPWDPGVDVISDDLWRVGFTFAYDRIVGLVEPHVSVPFLPGVFHTYELSSSDMRTYGLSIDRQHVRSGVFRDHFAFPPAHVLWGDGTQGGASLSRWELFEFGVVPETTVGDTNCNGVVDFGDINPFVLRLTNPAGYEARYPQCSALSADINADGKVDFGDINPFVALLSPG